MGIFKKPNYEETETDKAIKRQIAEEEKLRIATEKKMKERKKRIAKGMVGSRSMFTKAGGQGFYDEDGKI
tara:strand:- start:3815 stop:4024 length:210 start_codon:yes stop_codon:yes gene_type:complete